MNVVWAPGLGFTVLIFRHYHYLGEDSIHPYDVDRTTSVNNTVKDPNNMITDRLRNTRLKWYAQWGIQAEDLESASKSRREPIAKEG